LSKHFELIKSLLNNKTITNLSHPKINKVFSIIEQELDLFRNQKLIIFTQYREMAELLKNKIKDNFQNLQIEKFIGQTSKIDDLGFSQCKQIEILDDFRKGETNILIATSVAEEGLDIPNVDAIIFYEPVPSEIRLIQRRGRTGRFSPGRCYILLTESTSDISYFRAASRKEEIMNSLLKQPTQLDLNEELKREVLDFSKPLKSYTDLELIKNFKERKMKEKEMLTNRSIEDILNKIDNYAQSDHYQKLKDHGVTFYHDIVKIDQQSLKSQILKLKGNKKESIKTQKTPISKKMKTLINITKMYSKNNRISISKLKSLADQEDIPEKSFYQYLNKACYLDYLKKDKNYVELIKDCS
ncbi:MAG: helicase-related protein, partial [Candidatus Hermodarchaeota archaeon]